MRVPPEQERRRLPSPLRQEVPDARKIVCGEKHRIRMKRPDPRRQIGIPQTGKAARARKGATVLQELEVVALEQRDVPFDFPVESTIVTCHDSVIPKVEDLQIQLKGLRDVREPRREILDRVCGDYGQP